MYYSNLSYRRVTIPLTHQDMQRKGFEAEERRKRQMERDEKLKREAEKRGPGSPGSPGSPGGVALKKWQFWQEMNDLKVEDVFQCSWFWEIFGGSLKWKWNKYTLW